VGWVSVARVTFAVGERVALYLIFSVRNRIGSYGAGVAAIACTRNAGSTLRERLGILVEDHYGAKTNRNGQACVP